MDKFTDKIEKQIIKIQSDYQNTFDSEMTKNNSVNIAQISSVLQMIRRHTHQSSKPDSLQQIKDFCIGSARKEFQKIQ